jgi:hypothetical protein
MPSLLGPLDHSQEWNVILQRWGLEAGDLIFTFKIFDRPTDVYTILKSPMYPSSKTYMVALAALPLFLLGPFFLLAFDLADFFRDFSRPG